MSVAMGIVCFIAMVFGVSMMPHRKNNSNMEQATTSTVETNTTDKFTTE